MSKYKDPKIKVHFAPVPNSRYTWILYNKDGIPIAESCQKYKRKEKAKDSALQACLDISYKSIELED